MCQAANKNGAVSILVGGDWNMTGLLFHGLGMSSPQLTFTFFRGVGIPPTRIGCLPELEDIEDMRQPPNTVCLGKSGVVFGEVDKIDSHILGPMSLELEGQKPAKVERA